MRSSTSLLVSKDNLPEVASCPTCTKQSCRPKRAKSRFCAFYNKFSNMLSFIIFYHLLMDAIVCSRAPRNRQGRVLLPAINDNVVRSCVGPMFERHPATRIPLGVISARAPLRRDGNTKPLAALELYQRRVGVHGHQRFGPDKIAHGDNLRRRIARHVERCVGRLATSAQRDEAESVVKHLVGLTRRIVDNLEPLKSKRRYVACGTRVADRLRR